MKWWLVVGITRVHSWLSHLGKSLKLAVSWFSYIHTLWPHLLICCSLSTYLFFPLSLLKNYSLCGSCLSYVTKWVFVMIRWNHVMDMVVGSPVFVLYQTIYLSQSMIAFSSLLVIGSGVANAGKLLRKKKKILSPKRISEEQMLFVWKCWAKLLPL